MEPFSVSSFIDGVESAAFVCLLGECVSYIIRGRQYRAEGKDFGLGIYIMLRQVGYDYILWLLIATDVVMFLLVMMDFSNLIGRISIYTLYPFVLPKLIEFIWDSDSDK